MNAWEVQIVRAVQRLGSDFLDDFFRVITQVGEAHIIVAVAVFLFVCLGLRSSVRYAFVLGLSLVSVWIVKEITARPRPHIYDPILIDGKTLADGYAFPSGHTMSAFITCFVLFMAIRHLLNRAHAQQPRKIYPVIKIATAIILASITLLVGLSRIYLGVHYLSDVVVSIALGFLFYYVFTLVFDKYLAESKVLKYVLLVGAVAFVVIAILGIIPDLSRFQSLGYAGLILAISITLFFRSDAGGFKGFWLNVALMAPMFVVFFTLENTTFWHLNSQVGNNIVVFIVYLTFGFCAFFLTDYLVKRKLNNKEGEACNN